MQRLKGFLIEHDVMLKFFAVVGSSLVIGGWSFLTFVYPDFIAPWFDSGKLESEIVAVPKGSTSEANIWSVVIRQKNTGKVRLYVPASYFYVRAFRFTDLYDKDDVAAPKDVALQEQRSEVFDEMFSGLTPSGQMYLVDGLHNEVFNKYWKESIKQGSFHSIADIRSGYGPRDNILRSIHFGRLDERANVLEPKESSESEFLVAIPREYQAMQIDFTAIVFKKNVKEEFYGIPYRGGVKVFPLRGGEDLKERLSKIEVFSNEAISGLDLVSYFSELSGSWFFVSGQKQFFLGENSGEQKYSFPSVKNKLLQGTFMERLELSATESSQ